MEESVIKRRVNVYIDGFNLYHSALQKRISHDKKGQQQYRWPQFRWLDLKKLADRFIDPTKEKINKVYYFSAVALWLPNKAQKHKDYISALRSVGVEIILGQFKVKDRKCPLCSKNFISHEEKKTDINIAVKLLEDAFVDDFDSALIVSGDSDLIPAVETMKKMFPMKRVGLVLPPYQKGIDLISRIDYVKKITSDDLKTSLLPSNITFAGNQIKAPQDWLPKENKKVP